VPLRHADHAAEGQADSEGSDDDGQGMLVHIFLRLRESDLCLGGDRLARVFHGVGGILRSVAGGFEGVLGILLAVGEAVLGVRGNRLVKVLRASVARWVASLVITGI